MTKEEAINLLKQVNEILINSNSWLENTHEPLNQAFDMAIKALEQQSSEDCVSRQAVLDKAYAYGNGLEPDGYCVNVEDIQALPPVTPTHCIAEVRFSKEDLREICNERIEIECTHGTCKECKHWKDSDGVYRRGIGAESECPINIKEVYEGTFYCKGFKKRGNEDD